MTEKEKGPPKMKFGFGRKMNIFKASEKNNPAEDDTMLTVKEDSKFEYFIIKRRKDRSQKPGDDPMPVIE